MHDFCHVRFTCFNPSHPIFHPFLGYDPYFGNKLSKEMPCSYYDALQMSVMRSSSGTVTPIHMLLFEWTVFVLLICQRRFLS